MNYILRQLLKRPQSQHPHLERVVLDSQVLGQDVQHSHHLREDEDSVPPVSQSCQQFI